MREDSNKELVPLPDSLTSQGYLTPETVNQFQFNCRTPGVYSIVLSVYDRAGNVAKARKIFNFNDQPSITTTSAPMKLDKADLSTIYRDEDDPDTEYQFINKLIKPQNNAQYQFTVSWKGRFISNYNDEWLRPVKPIQPEPSATYYDDTTYCDGKSFGTRSINGVTNFKGVLGYEYAWTIDNSTGGRGIYPPENFTNLPDTSTEQFTMSIDQGRLKDGHTIVVWLRAYDFNGTRHDITTRTYVDTDNQGHEDSGAKIRQTRFRTFQLQVYILVACSDACCCDLHVLNCRLTEFPFNQFESNHITVPYPSHISPRSQVI